jgi:hypothetical protein
MFTMAKPAATTVTEKPLPEARPGTSGTQMLMQTRRTAETSFQRAYRAEQAYLAKKQAAAARADVTEARTHFKEAGRHLGLGVKKSFTSFKAVPAMLKEKREATRQRAEARKRERVMEKKKKWEEVAAMVDQEEASTAAAEKKA